MKTYLLCAVLGLASSAALAQKAVITGHGSTACGDWVHVADSTKGSINSGNMGDAANKIGMGQWVMGYLSGINSARIERNRETYDLPNYNTMEAFVNKACSENPLQNLYQAAMQLQLAIRRQEQSAGHGKD